jgi:tetratricopeptide (TPR) repeat protein
MPKPFHNRGTTFVSQGEYDRAIQNFERAIHLNPNDPLNYKALALTYSHKGVNLDHAGDLDGAIREYREAIDLFPDSAQVHYKLCRALRDKGDFDAALQELQQASALDRGNPTYKKAAAELRQQMNH